jgi:hypothetical protein
MCQTRKPSKLLDQKRPSAQQSLQKQTAEKEKEYDDIHPHPNAIETGNPNQPEQKEGCENITASKGSSPPSLSWKDHKDWEAALHGTKRYLLLLLHCLVSSSPHLYRAAPPSSLLLLLAAHRQQTTNL